jgi:hypothetical protein
MLEGILLTIILGYVFSYNPKCLKSHGGTALDSARVAPRTKRIVTRLHRKQRQNATVPASNVGQVHFLS